MTDPWKIAQENQGLIKSYLSKNRWIIDKSHTLEWEDYWNEGLMILFDLASRYDETRGIKFSSYAMNGLKQGLIRAYHNQAFPVLRVPVHRHPKKGMDLSSMNAQESFTYNILNCRVDLSATNYMTIAGECVEEESLFVFFK